MADVTAKSVYPFFLSKFPKKEEAIPDSEFAGFLTALYEEIKSRYEGEELKYFMNAICVNGDFDVDSFCRGCDHGPYNVCEDFNDTKKAADSLVEYFPCDLCECTYPGCYQFRNMKTEEDDWYSVLYEWDLAEDAGPWYVKIDNKEWGNTPECNNCREKLCPEHHVYDPGRYGHNCYPEGDCYGDYCLRSLPAYMCYECARDPENFTKGGYHITWTVDINKFVPDTAE